MAKKVKGNHTQNPNRLQKQFFIPCEVFRNERERRESGFPGENCRYVSFPSGKRALVGFIKTNIKPNNDLVKDLWNSISRQLNEWHRNCRCQIPGKHGFLIRCPDSNKCSDCPFGVKAEDRQPTIINWEEPENITCYEEQDNPVMNEAETELELDAIIEAMKRKNSDIAEVFVRCYLHGYEVSEIASDLGMQERRVRYLLKQGEEFRDRMMNY